MFEGVRSKNTHDKECGNDGKKPRFPQNWQVFIELRWLFRLQGFLLIGIWHCVHLSRAGFDTANILQVEPHPAKIVFTEHLRMIRQPGSHQI